VTVGDFPLFDIGKIWKENLMSSPNKKRRNCTRYKASCKAGTRCGGSGRVKGHWKDTKKVKKGGW